MKPGTRRSNTTLVWTPGHSAVSDPLHKVSKSCVSTVVPMGRKQGTQRARAGLRSGPNKAVEPTPTAFARASLRLLARLTAGVRAPSEAWRFLQGASPCGARSNQPLLPSVAPVKEVRTERHGRSVHRAPRRLQGRPHSLKL